MSPFLWLLFVLAAAILATLVAGMVISVVDMARKTFGLRGRVCTREQCLMRME